MFIFDVHVSEPIKTIRHGLTYTYALINRTAKPDKKHRFKPGMRLICKLRNEVIFVVTLQSYPN